MQITAAFFNPMLPETITKTSLFANSLGRTFETKIESGAAQKLIYSLSSFRERSAVVAAEIHRDLPDLTVHDITHLDALWEIADIITGPNFSITPLEAYVLGGAFLLHDLGMALCTHGGGVATIRESQEWKDLVAAELSTKTKNGEKPSTIASKDAELISTARFLRNFHAKQAETLARNKLAGENYLIEDSDIRNYYGRNIGLIAHSHWWSISKLEAEFGRPVQPAPWCPSGWTLDPLKVAAILRVADFAHIDGRRAPRILRRLRNPLGESDRHWCFQEKLSKPGIQVDALEYSSGEAFTREEAGAWWLAMDTLTGIDRELRAVDALLADRKLARFAAHRVAGVESPERLVAFLPTDRWIPFDAKIFVSDLPAVVEALGGAALYGRNLRAALRELVQNGADAIRARRALDKRNNDWGQIRVSLVDDVLEVNDCGIGMSSEVLTRYLLDFGKTFWGSDLMRTEFPGLQSSSFRPTGKYGIGFFSVFMLGTSVSVRTRRFDASREDTWIMEFEGGVRTRPIVRKAEPGEMLTEGGTVVTVKLSQKPTEAGGLLHIHEDNSQSLFETIKAVAPALDVCLLTNHNGVESKIPANWWKESSPEEFITHLGYEVWDRTPTDRSFRKFIKRFSDCVQLIKSTDGKIYGRAFIQTGTRYTDNIRIRGYVTVGGLEACTMNSVGGILIGEPTRASRDTALPLVPLPFMKSWATDQGELLRKKRMSGEEIASVVEIVRTFGGITSAMHSMRVNGQWTTDEELISRAELQDSVFAVHGYEVDRFERLDGFKYDHPMVVVTNSGIPSIIDTADGALLDWPPSTNAWSKRNVYFPKTGSGHLCELLAKAWNVDPATIEKSFIRQNLVSCISINGKNVTLSGNRVDRPKIRKTGDKKSNRRV